MRSRSGPDLAKAMQLFVSPVHHPVSSQFHLHVVDVVSEPPSAPPDDGRPDIALSRSQHHAVSAYRLHTREGEGKIAQEAYAYGFISDSLSIPILSRLPLIKYMFCK